MSHCPDKHEAGRQIIPFLPTVPFYLEVTLNFMSPIQFISGTWMAVTCLQFTCA